MQCLVLNADYSFLNISDWFPALSTVIEGKAQVAETYNKEIRSQYQTFKMPAVIVMKSYVKTKARRRHFSANTRNILIRDGFKCAYCGMRLTMNTATKDHIIPESKGGKTTMMNLVAACKPCNSRKDNKSCSEAGMFPKIKPRELTNEERLDCIVKTMQSKERNVWNAWLKENNLELW
jgi:5-methylcytosine-specific restriction endonuclease McrA